MLSMFERELAMIIALQRGSATVSTGKYISYLNYSICTTPSFIIY